MMCSQANGERCWSSSSGTTVPLARSVSHGPFEVDGVPEHDRGDDKVQPAGSESLVIEGTVLDNAAAVETHCAAQCILGLALVQANSHAAAQLRAVQPVEREKRPVDAADFAWAPGQPVLPWVRGQLAQDGRPSPSPWFIVRSFP
jgi:hypothetical protein